MKRFVRYRDGENTLNIRPASRIVSIQNTVDGQIDMFFDPRDGTIGNVDTVELSVTNDKERDVMRAIVEAVNYSTSPIVLIADDHTSEYIHDELDEVDSIANADDTNPA